MKRIIPFFLGFFFLLGCSSDNVLMQQPAAPVPPVANFSASETAVETGATIIFTDDSQLANSYEWTFEGGNPVTSTAENPQVNYATSGLFSVTLKVTNEDGNDTETKVAFITVTNIEGPPVADFISASNTIETEEHIEFTDTSTGVPTEWAWEFEGGSPSSSIEQHPTVSYTAAETYQVKLTATNESGSDEEVKTNYITVTAPVLVPVADFNASATTITSGNEITFTDTSINEPTSWQWEFEGGSPSTSTEQNPIVNYNNFGTYEVTLTATNSAGSDSETKTAYITVNMQTASYTVTFKGNWSVANHPTGFPGGDHFSSAVGMVHKPGITFFEEKQLASSGIENMAENGNNDALSNEIDAIINVGNALNFINGGGLANGTSERTFTIQVTEEFSIVTLVSMIAPSPDWFVATENVNLFNNGKFITNLTVDAISYDAGTDNGPNFTSGNDDTNPAAPIEIITTAPLGNGTAVNPPMAFFIFVKN